MSGGIETTKYTDHTELICHEIHESRKTCYPLSD